MKNGLVQSVFDSALRRASQAGAHSIRGFHIALGELVELTPDAFSAEWRRLARGTPAENVVLHIHLVPAELQCMVCFKKYQPAGPAPLCPFCGSVGAKVISGEQCFVESIEQDNV